MFGFGPKVKIGRARLRYFQRIFPVVKARKIPEGKNGPQGKTDPFPRWAKMNIHDYTVLLRSLDRKALKLVGTAIGVYYLSVFIYALRWKLVLEEMGRNIPLSDLVRINLSSIFVNNITPMSRSGGEVLRITWLSKKYKVPIILSSISIVYERFSEIIPILILTLISISYFTANIILFILSLSLIMVLVWLKWDKLIRLSLKLFRLNLKENELLSVLDLQKKTRLNLAAVGLSSLVWALDILRLKLIALVFGWHPSLTLVAVISLANLVFGLLAFTPGGVGIVEGGLTGVLLYLGVPLPLSLSVTLLERFISYGLSTVVGFMVLATSGGMEIWKALR